MTAVLSPNQQLLSDAPPIAAMRNYWNLMLLEIKQSITKDWLSEGHLPSHRIRRSIGLTASSAKQPFTLEPSPTTVAVVLQSWKALRTLSHQ